MGITDRLSFLRMMAVIEGVSYLLFGLTMPLKYVWDITVPNKIVGYAHGWLFIAYIALCLMAIIRYRWNLLTAAGVLLASLIPFGTFVADAKVFKPEQEYQDFF